MSKAAGSVGGTVLPAASSAATTAAGAATYAASKAVGGAGVVATTAKTVAEGAANTAMDGASTLATMSKEKAQDMIRRLREYLETWVKSKIKGATESVVDRLPGVAKNMLEDPEMPRCVSRGKDRMIDSMWPDVREEIIWEVAVFLDGQRQPSAELEDSGVDCFRAFFRYHLFPYDKTFWGQLFDPVQGLYRLITLIPVYGTSSFMFLLIFLLIDKSDEFQLINFILSFKGMQFLTMGIIRCCIGFTMFMICVPVHSKGGPHHDCEDNGPGAGGALFASGAGFFLQVLLVWIALFMLRCSVEKGRSQLKGHVQHEHGGHSHVKGGYIQYFLWYDLVFFLFSCCLPGYVLITRKNLERDDWVLAQTVYAAQIVYGLLSAPFFVFTLPGLQRVLTHAMPTAYDRQGRCRKLTKPKPKQEPDTRKDEPLVSEKETEDIFKKMREIAGFS
jgi:hypothetical protein